MKFLPLGSLPIYFWTTSAPSWSKHKAYVNVLLKSQFISLITIIVFTDLTRTTNVGRNGRYIFYQILFIICFIKNSLSNSFYQTNTLGKYILSSAFLLSMQLLQINDANHVMPLYVTIVWCKSKMIFINNLIKVTATSERSILERNVRK